MSGLTPERRAALRNAAQYAIDRGHIIYSGVPTEMLCLLDAADEADRLREDLEIAHNQVRRHERTMEALHAAILRLREEREEARILLDAKERTLIAEHTARQEAQREHGTSSANLDHAAYKIGRLRARVARLEEVVWKYGQHLYDCDGRRHSDYACDCGFTAALAGDES